MFQEAYPTVSSDALDESSDMFALDEVMSSTFSDTVCPTNTPVAAENLREEELEECDENEEEYDSYGLYYDSDETESVEMDAYTMFNRANNDIWLLETEFLVHGKVVRKQLRDSIKKIY
jgi:hypothetical protein